MKKLIEKFIAEYKEKFFECETEEELILRDAISKFEELEKLLDTQNYGPVKQGFSYYCHDCQYNYNVIADDNEDCPICKGNGR